MPRNSLGIVGNLDILIQVATRWLLEIEIPDNWHPRIIRLLQVISSYSKCLSNNVMGGTSEQVSTSDLLTGKTVSNELLSVWWLFDNMEIRFHLY